MIVKSARVTAAPRPEYSKGRGQGLSRGQSVARRGQSYGPRQELVVRPRQELRPPRPVSNGRGKGAQITTRRTLRPSCNSRGMQKAAGMQQRTNRIVDPKCGTHTSPSLTPCLGHHPLHTISPPPSPCARLRRHARYTTHAVLPHTRGLSLHHTPQALASGHSAMCTRSHTPHTRALPYPHPFAVCGPLWAVCIGRPPRCVPVAILPARVMPAFRDARALRA